MSERKGLLNDEQEAFIGGLLDDAIKFKNPLLEVADGLLFKTVVTLIDNNLLDKVPEQWKNPLEPIIDEAVDGNWNEVGALIADFANEKIDVPGIDEQSEQLILDALVSLILGLLSKKVEENSN